MQIGDLLHRFPIWVFTHDFTIANQNEITIINRYWPLALWGFP